MIYIIKQEELYQNKVNSSLVFTGNCKMGYWNAVKRVHYWVKKPIKHQQDNIKGSFNWRKKKTQERSKESARVGARVRRDKNQNDALLHETILYSN